MEEWKSLDFLNFNNYEVSTKGKVRNVVTGRVLKPTKNKFGRYMLVLKFKKKRKGFYISRLVAMAFIPNPDNLPEVNHKDENKANNCIENLEWCDKRYNLEWSKVNRPICKYSTDGELLSTYWSIKETARCEGISNNSLTHYLRGLTKSSTCNGFIYRYEGDDPLVSIIDYDAIERKNKHAREYSNRPEVKEHRKEYHHEYHKEYYSRPEVKERYKERDRQYRLDNKEAIKAKGKEYRQANKEHIKKHLHEWYIANRERVLGHQREYRLSKKAEQKYVPQ